MNLTAFIGNGRGFGRLVARVINGEPGAITELVVAIACVALFFVAVKWWMDR